MYKVYLDETIIHDSSQEVTLIEPKVSLEENKAGTFEFGITPDNVGYDQIQKLLSVVSVYKIENGNKVEIFKGRVLEADKDFYNIKQVYCEGELAFLVDSIQRPAEFQDIGIRPFLEKLLANHNDQVDEDKKFEVGIVTVTDSNDSLDWYTNWEPTLEVIKDKLIDRLGGRIIVRNENGKRYLDYLADYTYINEQTIEFGENLLDYSENTSAADIATCLIPLGEKLEESEIGDLEAYTTIESVNGGKDYIILEDAVKYYGLITKTETWDDINIPTNLLTKGKEYLQSIQYESMTLSLSAVDLNLYSVDFERIKLGDQVQVKSKPHGMDMYFPVTQMDIYLNQPDKNTVELGKKQQTLTNRVTSGNTGIEKEIQKERQITVMLQSAINNATQMLTGSKGGYKIAEYDENGRWLRDLYMNAPNKEDATLVMQVNMNGIGFSRTGFDGPYLNAWTIDGVLLGEFIKAGSVQAEALSVEYKASVEEVINAAQLAAESNAGEYTDDKLKDYYTTLQIDNKFIVSEDGILASAKATATGMMDDKLKSYYTQAQVNVKTNEVLISAEKAAELYTDNKLVSYYTKSQIDVKTNSIELSVTEEKNRATSAESTLGSKIIVTAESIAAEVTRATAAEGTLKSSITQNTNSITAEVSRAISAESTLSSRISLTESQISLKVAKGDVSSQLSIESSGVTISGNRLVISSTYFKLTASGQLTCTSGTFSGDVKCSGTYGYTYVNASGYISGGYNGNSAGYIAFKTHFNNSAYGIRIAGVGGVAIYTPSFGVGAYVGIGSDATYSEGQTGQLKVITNITDNGNGTISWSWKTIIFTKGLMTTSL